MLLLSTVETNAVERFHESRTGI